MKEQNFLLKSIRTVWGLTLWVVLISTLVVINVFQTLSMLIFPFAPNLFRKINKSFAAFWWGACCVTLRHLQGMQVEFIGDSVPDNENAVLIANHQMMSDIPVLLMLGYDKKSLGKMKWFVKDSLKYVPGIGWGMVFLDCIFVRRNWTEDKNSVEAAFKKFHENKIPIWLLNFPEGTRRTSKKQLESIKWAQSKGMAHTNNVLLPKPKGFTATMEGLNSHAQAVYDITILYHGKVPTLFELITGNVKNVTLHVARFETEKLPAKKEDISQWLTDRFYQKDQLIKKFSERKSF